MNPAHGIRVMAAGVLLALAAGCASKAQEPTMADRMRGHASDLQTQADLKSTLAKDWDSGQAMIATGEKNLRDGQKKLDKAERDLKQAREQVQRGQKEVEQGRRLVRESEQRFREAYPDLELGGK